MVTTKISWQKAVRFTAREGGGGLSLLSDSAAELTAMLDVAARTDLNARLAAGRLAAIAPADRYNGPLSGVVMRPFLNLGDSRFSDGKTYGALYVADIEKTGLVESAHHQAIRMRAAHAPRGMAVLMQSYKLAVDGTLVDARPSTDPSINAAIYDPDSYAASQPYGRTIRDADHAGLIYESVRQPGGECLALFKGSAVHKVTRLDKWMFYFDGDEISEFGRVA